MLAVLASMLLHCADSILVPVHTLPPFFQEEDGDDPFWVPREMSDFARRRAMLSYTERSKAEELLKALVQPPELGGMGITYSSDRTRTINEVWTDRKANCISLTMAYVMLAKQLGIRAMFAESFDVYNWSRVAGLIIREKHMVAVIMRDGKDDLVADFLPTTRPRFGTYFVDVIFDNHAKSLYYSNRAVEALLEDNKAEARKWVELSIGVDNMSPPAWNIFGVIEKTEGNIAGAVRAYKIAIANNSKNVAAISNLAALYRDEGFYSEYAKLRAMENRLRKEDPYYHAFLATEALDEQDIKNALKSIQKAIKIHPRDPDFYITLCQVYMAQGKNAEAIGALAKAREYTAEEQMDELDRLIEEFRVDYSSSTKKVEPL